MLHAIKRSLSWYRPVVCTQDKKFDDAWAAFEPSLQQAKALVATLDTNQRLRNELKTNIIATLGMIQQAGGEYCQIKTVSTQSLEQLGNPQQEQPTPEHSEDDSEQIIDNENDTVNEKYYKALKLLKQYIELLVGVKKVVIKRTLILGDLDYYRGKVMYLIDKEVSKSKELLTAKEAMGKSMDLYCTINELAIENMRRAMDLRDQTLLVCLSVFMQVQADLTKGILHLTDVDSVNPEIAHAKWPDLEPLHTSIKYQIAEFKCTAADEDTVTLCNTIEHSFGRMLKVPEENNSTKVNKIVNSKGYDHLLSVKAAGGSEEGVEEQVPSGDLGKGMGTMPHDQMVAGDLINPMEFGNMINTPITVPTENQTTVQVQQSNPVLTPPILPVNRVAKHAIMSADEDEDEEGQLDDCGMAAMEDAVGEGEGGDESGIIIYDSQGFDEGHIWLEKPNSPVIAISSSGQDGYNCEKV